MKQIAMRKFLLIFFILICTIRSLKSYFVDIFSLPKDSRVLFCPPQDFACIHDIIHHAEREKKLIVSFMFNCLVPQSTWPVMYLGWVVNIFEYIWDHVIFVAYTGTPSTCLQEMIYLTDILPAGSFFVQWFGYALFDTVKPLGIVHLQDEIPWSDRTIFRHHQLERYESIGLVMRTYYDERIAPSVVLLPAPIVLYGYMIGNSSDAVYTASRYGLASQRTYRCLFVGQNLTAERNPEHAMWLDRMEFLSQASSHCKYEVGSAVEFDYHSHTYEEYIKMLAETALVPCPAGYNPETYRHYETLELGAIPMFVRPPTNISYLHIGIWNSYPGPIFTSWSEMNPFLATLTDDVLDEMQANVRAWYTQFKFEIKSEVRIRTVEFLLDTWDKGFDVTWLPPFTSDANNKDEL